MSAIEWLQAALLILGVFFFVVGTVGLLRFPDVYTRIHALTKVDNLGLGLVVLAVALGAESLVVAAKLALIWLLALTASAVVGHLVANTAHGHGIRPWTRGERR